MLEVCRCDTRSWGQKHLAESGGDVDCIELSGAHRHEGTDLAGRGAPLNFLVDSNVHRSRPATPGAITTSRASSTIAPATPPPSTVTAPNSDRTAAFSAVSVSTASALHSVVCAPCVLRQQQPGRARLLSDSPG